MDECIRYWVSSIILAIQFEFSVEVGWSYSLSKKYRTAKALHVVGQWHGVAHDRQPV